MSAVTSIVRSINVKDASVKTATVQIRSVIVSAKQMTLSVFRQVREENLVETVGGDFRLRGIPWGAVQYFWGDMPEKCHDGEPVLHVLWQKDDELRRSRVEIPGSYIVRQAEQRIAGATRAGLVYFERIASAAIRTDITDDLPDDAEARLGGFRWPVPVELAGDREGREKFRAE